MRWATAKKSYIVEKYLKYKSFAKAQNDFKRHFHSKDSPSKQLITYWVKKFRKYGTVHNLNVKNPAKESHSGRPRSVRNQANIDNVSESVGRSPKKSLRRRGQELNISRSSLKVILVKDLNMYPYRIQIKQSLTNADMVKRTETCQWFADKLEEDETFLDDVWFSDEAHFTLNGQVNSKNYVFWGLVTPDEVATRPLHSEKCTAWCAMSRHGIIGPYWFQDNDGRAITINTEHYGEVLKKFYKALGRRRGLVRDEQWFQQDGATPHTSNITLQWLRDHFGDQIISRRCAVEWAPHSPDLNPPDFYLWGYLKDNVYMGNPQTIAELKNEITRKIREITPDECSCVIDNFSRRVQLCLQRRSRHLEHVL